jgi:hypothetical protein
MEKVVYIFGAGFSAPLGLPVMNNFISKSKDMFFNSNKSKNYDYFKNIFNMIENNSYIKNFISSDLFNIEELLSILEMGCSIGVSEINTENFKNYIKDVIKFYTPKNDYRIEDTLIANWNIHLFGKNKLIQLKKQEKLLDDWRNFPFDKKDLITLYYIFFSYLFNLRIERQDKITSTSRMIDSSKSYSIITLNYDEILENYIEFINSKLNINENLKLDKNYDNNDYNSVKYAKLHGDISSEIILPTWSKNITANIKDIWNLSYNILKDANHIRIIGYSLPPTDNYVRYLFSNSFRDSKNLKKIDVITLDPSSEVEKRYNELFIFPNFNFKNGDFKEFLLSLYPPELFQQHESRRSYIEFHDSILENKHQLYMSK